MSEVRSKAEAPPAEVVTHDTTSTTRAPASPTRKQASKRDQPSRRNGSGARRRAHG